MTLCVYRYLWGFLIASAAIYWLRPWVFPDLLVDISMFKLFNIDTSLPFLSISASCLFPYHMHAPSFQVSLLLSPSTPSHASSSTCAQPNRSSLSPPSSQYAVSTHIGNSLIGTTVLLPQTPQFLLRIRNHILHPHPVKHRSSICTSLHPQSPDPDFHLSHHRSSSISSTPVQASRCKSS